MDTSKKARIFKTKEERAAVVDKKIAYRKERIASLEKFITESQQKIADHEAIIKQLEQQKNNILTSTPYSRKKVASADKIREEAIATGLSEEQVNAMLKKLFPDGNE